MSMGTVGACLAIANYFVVSALGFAVLTRKHDDKEHGDEGHKGEQ